ncbi:MAG: tRNA 4-thiouridine(8) synthase ThiI [Oscillospiraceae bacterium]|nr:tRNA 4-thiouridine(8) synthase ThiI [Oscillospiraceae bacterium]
MKEIVMVKYGEIALKGLNKSTFEDILQKNIKRRLKDLGEFSYFRRQSTIYVTPEEDIDISVVVKRLSYIFGIGAIQRCAVFPKDFAVVAENAKEYLRDALECAKTFKVEAKRADKKFPMETPQIQQELGGVVLSAFPYLKVDVHDPDVTVRLEIRDNGAYLSAERIVGAGGMPVGSSGKALLMLSGGIDSPVAGYMMAKRGLVVDCIHYVSPPYTSERARLKVEALAEKMTNYCGDIKFYCVPFTEIQEALRDNCPEEYFTVLMRRIMVKIANKICDREGYGAIITGESVAQVASQTLTALYCTNEAAEYPVFRPVIGMDKKEIIEISRKIETYETSTLPYEDCCTVFSPKHPKTKPRIEDIKAAEASYDFDSMIEKAVAETEIKRFKCGEQTIDLFD